MSKKYENYISKYKYSRTREKQVKIWVTESEKEILQSRAKAEDMTVSDYLRNCGLNKSVVKINPEELASISLGLNEAMGYIKSVKMNDMENEEQYMLLEKMVEDMQTAFFKALNEFFEKYL